MRLPYSWLREVVAAGAPGWDVPAEDLEQALIRIGHEVEDIIPVGPVSGPLTVSVRTPPRRLARTSTKPGPPSDCGARTRRSSGREPRHPAAIDCAACTAVRLSPKQSGAMSTVSGPVSGARAVTQGRLWRRRGRRTAGTGMLRRWCEK